MGYTHYWRNVPKLNKPCLTELKQICAAMYAANLIQHEGDNTLPPIVTADTVRFNGVGDDSYETFLVSEGSTFDFCKTGNRPYDKVVVACLKVIEKHHAKDGFTWSSDGEEENFTEAYALLQQLGIIVQRPTNGA